MKILKVQIENYRSIRDLELSLKDLTVLIGENNAGKTNILTALELFFSPAAKNVGRECFFGMAPQSGSQIKISVTFSHLNSEELVKFRKYLINDTLGVCKTITFDATGKVSIVEKSALVIEPIEQYLRISEFDQYKERLSEIVAEKQLPDYFRSPSSHRVTQESYRAGLERYLEENRRTIQWGSPRYSDQFFGWKEVAEGYLPDYLYVPAVREIGDETKPTTSTYFGRIFRTVMERMLGDSPEAQALDKKLRKLLSAVNRPEDAKRDTRLKELRQFEKELSSTLGEHIEGVKLRLEIDSPSVAELLTSGTRVFVNDGIETNVEFKGHGLQRSLLLVIFRLYSDFLKKHQKHETGRSIILAIEEPELFLHPHSQRRMFKLLKEISKSDQVIACTHSPFFIDINSYESFSIIRKNPQQESAASQLTNDIFSSDERRRFRILNEFDPERSEMLFARKVVLVEGDAEKVAFPIVFRKLAKDVDSLGISIIECGGKFNIELYVRVLNAFKIPCVVIHDVDPVSQGLTGRKLAEATRCFNANTTILTAIDPALGRIETLDPDFDTIAGIRKNQIRKYGKPFASFQKFRRMKRSQIPQRIVDVAQSISC